MISRIGIKELNKKADKIANLKEHHDLVIDKTPYLIDSFDAFYEAYKIDREVEGFPVAAQHLYKQATNIEDKETLCEWWSVSHSLEELENKGFIKPQDLDGITLKGALAILEQAWDNLTQDEDIEDAEEECQHQRHA